MLLHATTLVGDAGAGVIDEDSSHRLCRDREEVGPIVKRHGRARQETDAELVHQRVWFERMIAALPLQKTRGNLPQLWVNNGKQLIAGVVVAALPVGEPHRYLL